MRDQQGVLEVDESVCRGADMVRPNSRKTYKLISWASLIDRSNGEDLAVAVGVGLDWDDSNLLILVGVGPNRENP
ncbi:MAG: hypothetical protein ACI9UA_003854 [Pseudoalteromonas tetraodonis]|jgi:hypothetical protein